MVTFTTGTEGDILFLQSAAGEKAEFGEAKGKVTTLTVDEQTKMSEYTNGEFGTVAGVCNRAFSNRFLSLVVKALKPGGTCVLQMPKASNGSKALMFAGLAEIQTTAVDDTIEQVSGKYPEWDEGSVAAVKISSKVTLDAWNIAADDEEEDAELEDEDDLLEKDGVDTAALKDSYDCGTSKKGAKKACKDCSCGLAEELQANDAAEAPPKSNCGSCGLGDAFRCSTCPYLGTPAFKKGDAVKLSL